MINFQKTSKVQSTLILIVILCLLSVLETQVKHDEEDQNKSKIPNFFYIFYSET
jgi:uncharacterized membrane protein YadS